MTYDKTDHENSQKIMTGFRNCALCQKPIPESAYKHKELQSDIQFAPVRVIQFRTLLNSTSRSGDRLQEFHFHQACYKTGKFKIYHQFANAVAPTSYIQLDEYDGGRIVQQDQARGEAMNQMVGDPLDILKSCFLTVVAFILKFWWPIVIIIWLITKVLEK
jgi:hypothetical protein